MKTLLLYIFLILITNILSESAFAQQPTNLPSYGMGTLINHIRTWTATAPLTTDAALMQGNLLQSKEATQYFDGLGRPLQTVIKKGSLQTTDPAKLDGTDTSTAKDLVTPVLYDEFGREQYQFLPFASTTNNGSFKADPYGQRQTFMDTQYGNQGNDKNFGYSQTVFEASPLNRVMESFAPGESWAGTATQTTEAGRRSVKAKHWINTPADAVRIWTVTDGAIGSGGSGVQADVTYNSRTSGGPATYTATNSITFADGFQSLPGDNFTASIFSGGSTPTDLITTTYASTAVYQPGTLYKNATVDEEGKQVIEFKDKEGKVILKKVQLTATADDGSGKSHDNWMCTYYVYDDLNNLRCVIQPEGVKALSATNWQMTTTILKEQCFRYEYDHRNRLVVKKVPGAAEVAMVYDVRDRLVMIQDGNLRVQGIWNFTSYDNLNRPVKTGLVQASNDPNTHWTAAKSKAGETNEAISYPTAGMLTGTTALTETFYDDYSWLTVKGITAINGDYSTTHNSYLFNDNASDNGAFPYDQQNRKDTRTKGMVTGSRINILGTANYVTTLTIYGDKARPIQVKSINQTGGVDITTIQYSWSGQPLVAVSQQQKNDVNPLTVTSISKNTYDALGRVTQTTRRLISGTINSGDKVIAQNMYDALGQLKTKKLGGTGTTPIETQNYEYNIRGWLLGMNRGYVKNTGTTHKFGYDLAYNRTNNNNGTETHAAVSNYTQAFYNGNIAGMTWRVNNGTATVRRYDFNYDAANRILKASYGQLSGSSFVAGTVGTAGSIKYDMQMGNGIDPLTAYDFNGNIKKMVHYGYHPTTNSSLLIDDLTYTYKDNGLSNKLGKVTDAVSTANNLGDFTNGTNTDDDYDYDINGNLTKDQNKKISSITYNILNLPQTITVTDKGTIEYLYDAAGNKLKKTVNETSPTVKTTTTQYVGGMIFENNVLQHVSMEEGRIRPVFVNNQLSSFTFDYFLKDHLGNVRAMLADNGTVLEETHYYPFGLVQKGVSVQASASLLNKYKFNSIEENTDLGLNQYDAAYRNLDPQLGRFMQIDPRPSHWESPYVAMRNDPFYFSDILGDTAINGVALTETEWNSNITVTGYVGNESRTISNYSSDLLLHQNFLQGMQDGVSLAIQDQLNSLRPSEILAAMSNGLKMAINPAQVVEETINDINEVISVLREELPHLTEDELQELSGTVSGYVGTSVAIALVVDKRTALRAGSKILRIIKASKSATLARRINNLRKAGNALDKNGRTAAGRALQKHGSRIGSKFPKATGNETSINAQGEAVLNGIITNPKVKSVTRHHARFGNVREYRIPGGQGARFSADGKTFIGFLE